MHKKLRICIAALLCIVVSPIAIALFLIYIVPVLFSRAEEPDRFNIPSQPTRLGH